MNLASYEPLLVGLLILALIARQFLWRAAEPRKLFTMPILLLVVGLVSLGQDVARGGTIARSALAVVGVEVALVVLTGLAMGAATEFSRRSDRLVYRLSRPGIFLWLLFVGIRVGSFIEASRLGARVLETTGAILLVFGLNRLISALVIAWRIERREGAGAGRFVADRTPGW